MLWASLVAQTVKSLPAMREPGVRSLGREDPLEKGTATHSSILSWRIPWTEEPGGLQSMGSQRVRHDWVTFTSGTSGMESERWIQILTSLLSRESSRESLERLVLEKVFLWVSLPVEWKLQYTQPSLFMGLCHHGMSTWFSQYLACDKHSIHLVFIIIIINLTTEILLKFQKTHQPCFLRVGPARAPPLLSQPSFYSIVHPSLKVLIPLFCYLLIWLVEKAMAPHSSTLAWRIPWTEEPGRLQSMGSLRVGHDWATSLSLFTFLHWRRKWQPTPVFLPGESQGRGSLVGCRLWHRTKSDTTEAT